MSHKILSVVLSLLYLCATTGFCIVRCDNKVQMRMILKGNSIENCICNEQKSSHEQHSCCSYKKTANNSLSDICNVFSENSGNLACCSLSFQKLEAQANYVSQNNYNSTDYSILFYPVAIIQNTNFVFEKNNVISKNKPSHITLRGHSALIYQFCQMRN
ncbi:MAG: hypothetical protein FWF72_05745 [Paludibacter sp.]|nr:hypothetical protein [Paludibacter sp.]